MHSIDSLQSNVKLKKRHYLSMPIFLAIMFFCIFGRMQYGAYSIKMVVSITIIVWMLICMVENQKSFSIALTASPSLLVLLSILIRFFLLLCSPEGIVGSMEFVFLRLSMYVPMFAFLYYRTAVDRKTFKQIVMFVLLIWVLCELVILFYINFDIQKARLISAGRMSRGYFGSLLDIVIGTACIILGFYGARKRSNNRDSRKKILVFFCGMMLLYIILSYYTQSFIAMFIGLFGILLEMLFANRERNLNKRVTLFVLLAAIMILTLVFREAIGAWIISISHIFEGSIFKTKMMEIGNTLISNSSVGDLNVRVRHFSTSFESFLNSPLWGTVVANGYTTEISVVGMHSGMDVLARYGLLGGLPLLLGEFKYLLLCKKITRGFFTNTVVIVAVAYFILSGWEHVEGLIALLFLSPALSLIFERENESDIEVR